MKSPVILGSPFSVLRFPFYAARCLLPEVGKG
jgi:hypothetical protein